MATAIELAKQREYRRIRKMVVSMRIHALGKASYASRTGEGPGVLGFYRGQEDAMGQLLVAMAPKEKPRAAPKPRKRSER